MRLKNTVVPDGGWGWVIVACSFLIHMFVVGTLYALSVLYVSWLDAFHNSKGYTSWILSLAVAVMFGIGPLAGLISRHFNNRVTVVAGGMMMFVGFLASVFAEGVLHLICSVGIVVGIGAGCCYLPSVSMVAMYFDRKRSIAMGISSAGLGVGAFLMPLYLNWMVENYGWRGCMLILSGLSLNMCVLGILMRPLVTVQTSEETEESDALYHERLSSLILRRTVQENAYLDQSIEHYDDCSTARDQGDESTSCISNCHHQQAFSIIEISRLDDNQVIKHFESPCPTIIHEPPSCSIGARASEENMKITNNNVLYAKLESPRIQALGNSENISDSSELNSHIGGSLQCIKQHSTEHNIHSSSNASIAHSMVSLRNSNNNKHQPSIESSLSTSQMMMAGGLYNALYSSRVVHSMSSFHSNNNLQNTECGEIRCSVNRLNSRNINETLGDHEDDTTLEKNTAIQTSDLKKLPHKIIGAMKNYLNLFKNGTFMVFCISNFLTNLSFFMPVLYMVDRAIDEGISRNGAAIFVSLYGIGNIFGKLFFGWLADRGIVDRLVIYMGCLCMAGLTTCLSPLCGDSRVLHGAYSFSFGCFIGSYCTLYPIVTVDLVGLELVDESVGILLCFMGVATAFGSPLAGWIFDWTGTYTIAFILHGIFILTSALMLMPLYVSRQRRKS